jgi:hypothetical protein
VWLEEQLELGDNAIHTVWDDGNKSWENIPFNNNIKV